MKGSDKLSRRHPFRKQEPQPIDLSTITYRSIGDDANTVQARKFSWLSPVTRQVTHIVLDAENNNLGADVPDGLEPISNINKESGNVVSKRIAGIVDYCAHNGADAGMIKAHAVILVGDTPDDDETIFFDLDWKRFEDGKPDGLAPCSEALTTTIPVMS